MYKVSVITPVYNGVITINETIKSILSQSHKNFELIVVDDGSIDNSEKIIKSFKDSRIKYYKIENSGSPARPRNFGIKEATGDFIAFCDQDDVWYKDKLEKQIQAYNSNKNKERIGLIATSANFIDENGSKVGGNYYERDEYINSGKARELLLSSNFITACSSLVPAFVIKEIGFLNENLKGIDDYDYWLRITKKYGVLKIKDPLCAWRKSKSALSANKTDLYSENEKIFKELEKKENNQTVINAHTKNLNRIFVSSIIENKQGVTGKVFPDLKKRKLSAKSKFVVSIYSKNSNLGIFLVRLFKKVGLIKI